MGTRFKNRYRINSARADWWDYSRPGGYFLTINVAGNECVFGQIVNDEMILSELGRVAYETWMNIPHHYPHIHLDEFQVMPNHIHGILVIYPPDNNKKTENDFNFPFARGPLAVYGKSFGSKRFQKPGPKSISSAVGSFKSAVSKTVHDMSLAFKWNDRFHDHII